MKMNITSNLKRLRKQKGITQEALAEFIGVSFQAISKWERNEGLSGYYNFTDYRKLF